MVMTWLFDERTAPPEWFAPIVGYGKTEGENLIDVLSKLAVDVVNSFLQSCARVKSKNGSELSPCSKNDRENVGSFNLMKSPLSFSIILIASHFV